jgi:hypothetical protein
VPFEILGVVWQDIALSVGGAVGLCSKMYALYDSRTVWSRKSSIPTALFFLPSIAALYSLDLHFSAVVSTGGLLLWTGIAIWRSPPDEDLLGKMRKDE